MSASATEFVIKRGDLEPPISATIKDSTGAAVNLTGATAPPLVLKPIGGGSSLRYSTGTSVVSAAAGTIKHLWQTGETTTAGVFFGEWEVTWPSSRPQTFPTEGTFSVVIEQDQG